MYLTLRLDDITPGMDMGKFTRFRELMDRYGIRPLLGVVPDPKDPSLARAQEGVLSEEDFFRMLRDLQAKGYCIAMHGYTHVYETKSAGLFPLNRQSEFAGRSYAEQKEMIRKGREILLSHGIETDVFMAPSHTFDRNTIRALLDNGFSAMTDGFGTRPYRYLGMKFYPISFLRKRTLKMADVTAGTGAMSDLSAGTNVMPDGPDSAPVPRVISEQDSMTLVVHTNTMSEADFRSYERIFATRAFLPYGELFTQEAAELSAAAHIKHYLMATMKRLARGF